MDGDKGKSIKKNQHYDRDFKVSAIKMVTEGGHKAAEVARSLGIDANRIYLWKRQLSDNGDKAFAGKGHLSEMAALRRKLREVEMENTILKKAVGIFSKETGYDSNS